MVGDNIHSGQLNYLVEILEKTHTQNSANESEITLVRIGQRFAKRSDDSVKDDDADGRVISMNTTSYIFRYEPFLIEKKSALVVRDFTGDYQVVGAEIVGNGRKRFVELKGIKRE